MTRRVAIYARVSTAGQDIGLQVDELRRVVQQRGWELSGEYIDEGHSGARSDRPELERLLADAQLGRFQVLVVWKLDRLARSLQHLLQVLDQLASRGVEFVSLRDPGVDTTTASGRLLLQVLGAFGEFERSLIVERVRAGVIRAQAAGRHCGRPRQDLDLRPALALLREGRGLKETAQILAVDRNTLRRRLCEAGEWPRAS